MHRDSCDQCRELTKNELQEVIINICLANKPIKFSSDENKLLFYGIVKKIEPMGLLLEVTKSDDLNPASEMKAKMEASFTIEDQGVFSFNTQVLGEKEDRNKFLILEFPELIRKYQRRQYYRVRPCKALPIKCLSLSGKKKQRSDRGGKHQCGRHELMLSG